MAVAHVDNIRGIYSDVPLLSVRPSIQSTEQKYSLHAIVDNGPDCIGYWCQCEIPAEEKSFSIIFRDLCVLWHDGYMRVE